MYQNWMFFRVLIDMLEMIFAKVGGDRLLKLSGPAARQYLTGLLRAAWWPRLHPLAIMSCSKGAF